MLTNKKRNRTLTIWLFLIIIWINLFNYVFLPNGISFDYLVYDFLLSKFYKQYKNKNIQYVLITNNTYSELFKSNLIYRSKIADAVVLLEELGVELIIFDIIFLHPSNPKDDIALSKVLSKYDNIIQPIALINYPDITTNKDLKTIKLIDLQTHLKLSTSNEIIFPNLKFLSKDSFLGHISDYPDKDGVMRHTRLIINKDSTFIPSLSFASFLRMKKDSVFTVKLIENEFLLINDSLKIPIDHLGRTLVPFVSEWGNDFEALTLEDLIKMNNDIYDKVRLRNSLNGKIVLIADVSASAADIYPTPLSKLTPLVMLHSSMLNALMNNIFIHKISFNQRTLVLNILLFILFSLFYKQKRIYLFVSLLSSIFLLTLLTLILFILGHFLFYVSIVVCLILSFTLGFFLIEFIFLKEKKIIELDNYRKSFEMQETKKILQNLMPRSNFIFLDYEISAYINSAEEVGGDFFDYYQNDEELKIFVADGSGHGLQAGILVVSLKTIITSLKLNGPSKTLFQINNTLKKINFTKLFLCMVIISVNRNYITFSVAGLPPLIHYKANLNKFDLYHHKNIPLGVKSNFEFIESTIKLEENDILFIYTDGLSELFNSKKEMLGIENIKQTLLKCSHKSTNEIVSDLKDLILKWKKDELQNDDITFLIIKKNKKPF
ncbi:MAG: CHASE2 domain-containing protein [Ignavibacterium sp.]|jgi:CHASE2 domain-containing sensor protein|uniref:SpoIIE family protein phosphatase n=1 Tax=Ignavibacterium sp. TaxID=2651167 RepID=UPI0032967E9B